MRKIKSIVIHHSDSDFGDVKLIRHWHISAPRNWKDVGYHAVCLNGKIKNCNYEIAKDGLIEPGRPLDNDVFLEWNEKGAHAKGFNRSSIGFCLIGKKVFTPKQFESMIYFCRYWKTMIPDIKIYGHCELSSYKTCPNMNPNDLRAAINNASVMAAIEGRLSKYFS